MSSVLKDEVRELVDSLPEAQLPAARRCLEYLRDVGNDPNAFLDNKDPFADMPETERERLHTALEQSEREFAAGLGIPADEVIRRLRASR